MEYKKSQGLAYRTSFKTKPKAMWTAMAVHRILSNPVYAGTLVQGKRSRPNYKIKTVVVNDEDKWVVVENAHEAIIDAKTFLLVQRLLELDTRTSPHEDHVYPLAGLLYCEDCKGPMVRKNMKRSHYTKAYYICGTHKVYNNCSSHLISADEIEDAVLRMLRNRIAILMEMESILGVIQKSPSRKISIRKAQERMVAVDAEIDRFRRLKVSAYEDYKDGILGDEDYEDIRTQYEQRIADAMLAREQVEREMNFYLQNEATPTLWIKDFLEHKNLTMLTRSIAVQCIQRIEVSEGKRIEVVFSHQNDFEHLLEEIEDFKKAQREVG